MKRQNSLMANHEPGAPSEPAPAAPRRAVRSFVLREGRLTAGQERAFRELWPRFGWDWQPGEPLDPWRLFGTPAVSAPAPPVSSSRVPSHRLADAAPTEARAAEPACERSEPASDEATVRDAGKAAASAPGMAESARAESAVPASRGERAARPVTLEIGFGDGESLAAMAAAAPERDFIGVEVHRPGVGHLLIKLEQEGLTNVRVLRADAMAVLSDALPAACLDRVQLYFPDPWPKKRHHKRRIVQPQVIAAVARVLQPGGIWHLATDWPPYAGWMLAMLDGAADLFENLAGSGNFSQRPPERPITKFERRGERLGHPVFDLLYRRR